MTGAARIVLAAVFDDVVIALGFMIYPGEHTSGLAVGLAPLGGLSYERAGLIRLPWLWE